MSEKVRITVMQADDNRVDFTKVNQIIRARRKNISDRNAIISFFRKIIMIALVLWIMFTQIFGFYIVYNDDMFPKMVTSDLVLYYRLDREFYVGDVVVVEKNDADYALRIIAGGGDKVELSPEGQMIVNGSYQAETNIFYPTGEYEETAVDIKYPVKLADDDVFALGDMRKGAKDSRYFGPVKKDEIKGKVFSLFRRSGF